jgi:hypothetical protein
MGMHIHMSTDKKPQPGRPKIPAKISPGPLVKSYLEHLRARRKRNAKLARSFMIARTNANQLATKLAHDPAAQALLRRSYNALLKVIAAYQKELGEPAQTIVSRRGASLQSRNAQERLESIKTQERIFQAFEIWLKEKPDRIIRSSFNTAKILAPRLGLGISTVRKYLDPVFKRQRENC